MNFLKRLELYGFKSFANKTVLEFPAKITAIVGPNGSGKSNIVDAFRWVLGEREAKQLRGEKLENLIFAGTPKKSPMNLAKVSLCFSNLDNSSFSFESSEVVLTRKVDRSGVSNFFLNNKEIRLKDLLTFLARARISTRGMIIIGQGEGDFFVKSSPLERRIFIEEVLGLKEFRLKKQQSERQLAQSQINLDKTRAALAELEPHLRILRRQKNRFEKRAQIEEELKKIEVNFFAKKHHSLREKIKFLDEEIKKYNEDLKIFERNIKDLEVKVNNLKKNSYSQSDFIGLKKKINDLLEKKSFLEKELGRFEFKKELLKNNQGAIEPARLFNLVDYLKLEFKEMLMLENLLEIKERIKKWLLKIDEVLKPKTSLEEEKKITLALEEIQENLKEINKELSFLNEQEDLFLAKQNEFNEEFRKLLELLEIEKKNQRDKELERERLNFERNKIINDLSELENRFESLGYEISLLFNFSKEKLNVSDSEIDEFALERRIMRLRNELMSIGEIDLALVREAEETERRYDFLVKEVKDLEKSIVDLKLMIKELNGRIYFDFKRAFHLINEEFNNFFRLMFGGGRARLYLKSKEKTNEKNNLEKEAKEEIAVNLVQENQKEELLGIEIEVNLPKKKIKSLEMLSGGEKTLVSIAVLFSVISVNPPPFFVLDEIDAALDEVNSQRFAQLVKDFSEKTQFIIITHNRLTMEAADVLYGITMGEDGVSRVLSLKLE